MDSDGDDSYDKAIELECDEVMCDSDEDVYGK